MLEVVIATIIEISPYLLAIGLIFGGFLLLARITTRFAAGGLKRSG